MFFLIYLPSHASWGSEPFSPLLTGARKGRTSTSFHSAVSKNKKTSRFIFGKQRVSATRSLCPGWSQPCILSCDKGLKFDPQIYREIGLLQQACLYSYRLLNAIGASWGILHWLGRKPVLEKNPLEHCSSGLTWADLYAKDEGNFSPPFQKQFLGLSRVLRLAKEWSWVSQPRPPCGSVH